MKGEAPQLLSSRLVVFRNTPFGVDAWHAVGEPGPYTGRFHRRGDALPLYTSGSREAALGELLLHTQSPLQPSRGVLRRITAVAVAAGVRILDADHRETLNAVGVTLEQVYDPADYSACHAIADYARTIPGVVAVSTQSNAERNQRTVAILPEHATQVTALVDYWEGSLNLLELFFDK